MQAPGAITQVEPIYKKQMTKRDCSIRPATQDGGEQLMQYKQQSKLITYSDKDGHQAFFPWQQQAYSKGKLVYTRNDQLLQDYEVSVQDYEKSNEDGENPYKNRVDNTF